MVNDRIPQWVSINRACCAHAFPRAKSWWEMWEEKQASSNISSLWSLLCVRSPEKRSDSSLCLCSGNKKACEITTGCMPFSNKNTVSVSHSTPVTDLSKYEKNNRGADMWLTNLIPRLPHYLVPVVSNHRLVAFSPSVFSNQRCMQLIMQQKPCLQTQKVKRSPACYEVQLHLKAENTVQCYKVSYSLYDQIQ